MRWKCFAEAARRGGESRFMSILFHYQQLNIIYRWLNDVRSFCMQVKSDT